MIESQNRFSFFRDYKKEDFVYIIQMLTMTNKARVLKGEMFAFQYNKVNYVGFAEDVYFFAVENGKQCLMIGGERQYIDRVESDTSFFTKIAAVFTSDGRLVRCGKSFYRATEIYHIHMMGGEDDNAALKYLLHSLPLVVEALGKDVYEIEQGDNTLRYVSTNRKIEILFYIRSVEKLVLRKSKKHPDEWRLAAIENDAFEAGKHSAVYKNLKTYRFDAKCEPIMTAKPRVYKSSVLTLDEMSDEEYRAYLAYVLSIINREESLLLRLSYLKSTKIVCNINRGLLKFSHFEAYLPGATLEDWVRKHYFLPDENKIGGYREVSTNEVSKIGEERGVEALLKMGMIEYSRIEFLSGMRRIDLALAMIDALMFVHKMNIVHCDLKPDNIMISEVKGKFSARVIDVNGSRFSSDESPNSKNVGSILFCSPESLEKRVPVFKSDVFSMAIVLAEVFGANFLHIHSMDDVLKLFASKYVFNDLFTNVIGLSEAQKESIKTILGQAVALNLDKRLTLLELREAFLTLSAGCIPVLPVKKKVSVVNAGMFLAVTAEQRLSAGQVSTKKLGF